MHNYLLDVTALDNGPIPDKSPAIFRVIDIGRLLGKRHAWDIASVFSSPTRSV